MTDYEIDLAFRVGRHPKWVWVKGMLGIEMGADSLYVSGLPCGRFEDGKDFSSYSPSASDPLTTYLVWEQIKKFNLPGYSLVRVCDPPHWKAGFKTVDNNPVLLFSSQNEGHVALRSWLWFSAREK